MYGLAEQTEELCCLQITQTKTPTMRIHSPMLYNANVWCMALQARSACLPLRPTSVGNMLLRCRNNLHSTQQMAGAWFVGQQWRKTRGSHQYWKFVNKLAVDWADRPMWNLPTTLALPDRLLCLTFSCASGRACSTSTVSTAATATAAAATSAACCCTASAAAAAACC